MAPVLNVSDFGKRNKLFVQREPRITRTTASGRTEPVHSGHEADTSIGDTLSTWDEAGQCWSTIPLEPGSVAGSSFKEGAPVAEPGKLSPERQSRTTHVPGALYTKKTPNLQGDSGLQQGRELPRKKHKAQPSRAKRLSSNTELRANRFEALDVDVDDLKSESSESESPTGAKATDPKPSIPSPADPIKVQEITDSGLSNPLLVDPVFSQLGSHTNGVSAASKTDETLIAKKSEVKLGYRVENEEALVYDIFQQAQLEQTAWAEQAAWVAGTPEEPDYIQDERKATSLRSGQTQLEQGLSKQPEEPLRRNEEDEEDSQAISLEEHGHLPTNPGKGIGKQTEGTTKKKKRSKKKAEPEPARVLIKDLTKEHRFIEPGATSLKLDLNLHLSVGEITQKLSRSQTLALLFNEIYAEAERGYMHWVISTTAKV